MRLRKLLVRTLLCGMAALSITLVPQPGRAEVVNIGLGIDAAYTPFFVAGHRGLFKKAGVDVNLIRFAQGGEAVDAVIAGQAQLSGAADQTNMIRIARGDLRALAIFEQSGAYIKLVVRPAISDPKEIKKFGIVKASVSEYSAQLALKKYGIDPATVQFVPSGPPELPALLARGDIDAFFAWEPWPGIAVKQGGKVIATSGDVGYAYTMWLCASGPWLDKNTVAAHGVLAALAEANREITADPAKAAEDLQTVTKLPAADAIGFLKETSWTVRDFTDADAAGFERIADFLVAQKATPTRVDLHKALQRGFFKE
jgi:NitT/TauT family transport system substrate-binding protein